MGGVVAAAAIVGMMTGKGLRDPMHQKVALAYGVPALVGSLIMASLTQTVSAASPQAVFRPQTGGVPAAMSPAARNYASLSQAQRLQQSVL